MGLRPDLPTAIVLFGGHGSKVMYDITERLKRGGLAAATDFDLWPERGASG